MSEKKSVKKKETEKDKKKLPTRKATRKDLEKLKGGNKVAEAKCFS